MTISLLVEGMTETGLRQLLSNAVNATPQQRCGFRIRRYKGASDLKQNIRTRVENEFRNAQTSVVYCIVDLHRYFLPSDARATLPVKTQAKAVKEELLSEVPAQYRSSVKIFVVIHEIETWILADSQVIQKRLKDYKPEGYYNLEEEGKYAKPAEFLNNLFKKYHRKKFGYNKSVDGTFLLQHADWQKIYGACSVFKDLIESLREDCAIASA